MTSRPAPAQRMLSAPQPQVPELLTAQELATALKLNTQTLYRLVRQGLVPAIRIGRKTLRFDLVQVRAALQSQEPPRPARGRRGRLAEPFTFTRLDDLRAAGGWLSPRSGLTLERFAVQLPPGTYLTTFAYDGTT